MSHKGSCHCGKVSFEVEGNLEKVMECNCSICSKRGSLHWFVPSESFHLLTPEETMGAYSFNEHKIKHHHCQTCGCPLYSEGIAPSGNYMTGVNARCLDDIDLSSVEIGHFDGRSL